MYHLFNKKNLQLIPMVFLIVIIFRISYTYTDTKEREYQFAKNEAEVLSSFALSHRNYYQKLFINKTLHINKSTLPALPAYSSKPISQSFSKENSFNITISAVSDRARNIENSANTYELEAIEYFKKNTKKTTFFKKEGDKFYHYASVLRVKQKCLSCHGKKSEAPQFIQDKYDKAYNYKLGDVRGIQSVKIPVASLDSYFMKYFYQSVVYDLILFILLFIAIFYITKKSKNINKILEYKVDEKTKELKCQIVQDRLTKFPNRIKLFWDIEENHANKSKHLALLNIDRFKDINDFYGHDAADLILIDISKKLSIKAKKINAFFYKLPSDEFAIYCTTKMDNVTFYKFVQNIITYLVKESFKINDSSLYINFSCGIASNVTEIITKADMALQHAKQDNIKTIVTYDTSLDRSEAITNNIDGIKLLKNAIQNDNIKPSFQPIYHLKSKKILKYESLARILTEDGQVISPYLFIDIARKSNLYQYITQAMISKSFAFFKDKDYEFSINLSIDDIENKNTVKFMIDNIQKFPDPSRIIFEILESDKINNYDKLKSFIEKIKNFGCKFAIDDFGSGYSNFAHILELNVDYLKIDASLVKNVTKDENSRIITKTIISFAASLGLETIAEYVEDKESLEMLEEMGADFIQGYYIGKPSSKLANDS